MIKVNLETSQPSFAACHLWHVCNYGRNGCEWGKTRPEKMEACYCFNKNSIHRTYQQKSKDSIESTKSNSVTEYKQDNTGQLSLF